MRARTLRLRRATSAAVALVAICAFAGSAGAQAATVALTPDRWIATDSMRFETHLGRPSLYINKGLAYTRDVDVRNGTIEYDMAMSTKSNFMGPAFRVEPGGNAEVVILRLGSSGTPEAMQYSPAFNTTGAAWQIYHGDDYNATVTLSAGRWVHVKVEIVGEQASITLDDAAKPDLVVPRVAGTSGGGIGVWAGNFGNGAWFSNITYVADMRARAAAPLPPLARGTIADWELSEMWDASTMVPGTLPPMSSVTWDKVRVEPQGFVLVNRYRRALSIQAPSDPVSHEMLVDSVLGGRVTGAKVVLARTVIESDRAQLRRLRFGYSDGVVIYANGVPLFSGMNPPYLRSAGIMDAIGDAVYVPLKKGRNEIVFAVTEFFGGWAFWARLEP